MKSITYNLKENEVLNLNALYEEIIINVLDNSDVTINEMNIINSNIILNINNNSKCKYISISNEIKNIKRNIILNQNSYLNIKTINLNKTDDESIININGIESFVEYNNLSICDNSNHNFNTTINHNSNSTESKINNIGVALNNANILFNTIGFVENGYKGCECRQLSKGVIIGDNSLITSKPILLINEYDVKAYHGATIGKMSDEELFYLMSRGLTKKESFLLILDGLINPFIKDLNDESLKEEVLISASKLLGE